MKIKVKPEDFTVKEISSLVLSETPKVFRVYHLVKRQWETFDLIGFLAHGLSIPKSDIAVSGIKDRYGDTSQLVSIRNRSGLPDRLEEKNFSLRHKGYTDEKLRAAHIDANEFCLVIRDIPYYQLDVVLANCREVKQWGFPNYYDEQRFGSARALTGFMGKQLFLGNMEEALKIYFAPSGADRREEKAFKQAITEHWRSWGRVTVSVPGRYARVFETLTTFGKWEAFTQAVNVIDRNRLIMALNGYQSYLFNQLLVSYLEKLKANTGDFSLEKLAFKYGDLFFWRQLSDTCFANLCGRELPVPGHDTVAADPDVAAALAAVLAEENISLVDLKVKKLPGKAVHGVSRNLVVVPENFSVSEPVEDDMYPGRYKLRLSFCLPRGSYATMLFKRISLGTR